MKKKTKMIAKRLQFVCVEKRHPVSPRSVSSSSPTTDPFHDPSHHTASSSSYSGAERTPRKNSFLDRRERPRAESVAPPPPHSLLHACLSLRLIPGTLRAQSAFGVGSTPKTENGDPACVDDEDDDATLAHLSRCFSV